MTLREFVKTNFEEVSLNCRDYVVQRPSLLRPTNLAIGRADPSEVIKVLNWHASNLGIDIVKKIYQSI